MSRIQDERSAETRKRLLDATVDCLFERGYAGTTTAEIAGRAGFSKGAQLHHFPTKEKLVISALEYLFELRLAAREHMSRRVVLPPLPVLGKLAEPDGLIRAGFPGAGDRHQPGTDRQNHP